MDIYSFIASVPREDEPLKSATKVVPGWSNRINNELDWNLGRLDPADARKIRSKLASATNESNRKHLFFETVLGGWLARSGYEPRYERRIGAKTPDWELQLPSRAIFEMVNIDPEHGVQSRLAEESAVAFTGNRANRLYEAIREKGSKYGSVVKAERVPFVVAVCPSFAASIYPEDFQDALENPEYGLFRDAEHLSGVLIFDSRVPEVERSYADHWNYGLFENRGARHRWNHFVSDRNAAAPE